MHITNITPRLPIADLMTSPRSIVLPCTLHHALFTSLLALCTLHLALKAQSWELLPVSPNAVERWDAMSFVHPDTGWIAGTTRSGMHRTFDGGHTWQECKGAYLDDTLKLEYRSLDFVSGGTGWAGCLGSPRNLLRTTDYGTTWDSITILDHEPHGVCGIDALDDTTMFCVGPFSSKIFGKPHFTRTLNGTSYTTWDLAHLVSGLVDVLFLNKEVGVIGGNQDGEPRDGHAVVLRTTDGGHNWTKTYVSTKPGTQLWKFHRRSDGVLTGAIQAIGTTIPYFITSSDNGVTWVEGTITTESLTPIKGMQTVTFLTPQLGWIGGRGFTSYVTTDGGESWTNEESILSTVNRFVVFGDTMVYAAGKQVYKHSGKLTSVENGDSKRVVNGEGRGQRVVSGEWRGVSANRSGRNVVIDVDPRFDVRECFVYDMLGRMRAKCDGAPGTHRYELSVASNNEPLWAIVLTSVDYLSTRVAK